ncbi:hypothetical protein ACQEU3_38555 [Spirillospora sp. CA-253888]
MTGKTRPGRKYSPAARAHATAHHNVMEKFHNDRLGRYRPEQPNQLPPRIPDEQFDGLFAGLRWHRDRALLAFWVSTAARAEELLTAPRQHVETGQQLIGVVRKGSAAVQHLPASPDAFVWLRLYQEELLRNNAPQGSNTSLWLTVRRRQARRRQAHPVRRKSPMAGMSCWWTSSSR